MRTEYTKIPLVAFVVLMLSSFVPIIHILLIQSVSVVSIPVNTVFGEASKIGQYLVYLIIASVCLMLYYRTKDRVSSIFYAIVSIGCLMSIVMLLLELVEIEPYYLNLMIMSTVGCLPLWLVGLAKERQALSNSSASNK